MVLTGASTAKVIEIDGRDLYSAVFMADGKHVLAGGKAGKIQCWRVADGEEEGKAMDVGNWVNDIAVSGDGKWIVCVGGTDKGIARVFDTKNRKMVRVLKGHAREIWAVNVSPDGTKIVTGSGDWTARVWLLSTGKELQRFGHNFWVAAAKFSPNGLLFVTATQFRNSVRIYDSNDGRFLANFKIEVSSGRNQSVAWHRDNKHLFVASWDGHIHHLDASTGNTLSNWRIYVNSYPQCIALASDSTYIAASAASSVSLWDAVTHEQLGSPIKHACAVESLALSPNHFLVASALNTITLGDLRSLLPARYWDGDIHDLYNKLTDARSRYKEQLHHLRVATLAAELDRRKRSVAVRTEKLAAVRRELDRFPDVSREILSARHDLRTFEARIHEMHQQYEIQLRGINSSVTQGQPESPPIQHSVADSDIYAEKALIHALESFNTHIRRTSISMSTYLIHHIQSPDAPEQSSAARRASMSIPQPFVDRLRTMSHHDIASHLSIAFRAYLTSYFCPIISSWITDPRIDDHFGEMYGRLLRSESQTFAASWRSLMHTNMPECTSEVFDILVSRAIQGLADIAVTADCAASTSDTASKLAPKFWNNISFMVATAEKLRELIGEAVNADYKVVLARPPQTFDETSMAVNSDRGIPIGRAKGKKVLCTTRLGLIKEVVQEPPNPGPSANISTMSTLLKTSVVLQEHRWD
ncbi:quinon protein alcohol dehydrogenase-like superfamily [Chiua virens]|nr:quinon protein alcohol dehydrogenase-like superfamily [Chiua virens]